MCRRSHESTSTRVAPVLGGRGQSLCGEVLMTGACRARGSPGISAARRLLPFQQKRLFSARKPLSTRQCFLKLKKGFHWRMGIAQGCVSFPSACGEMQTKGVLVLEYLGAGRGWQRDYISLRNMVNCFFKVWIKAQKKPKKAWFRMALAPWPLSRPSTRVGIPSGSSCGAPCSAIEI